MADPAGQFETTNFALTGSYLGMTVPQNVALICQWTLMCVEHYDNIHTNDLGYAQLADSFEKVIDPGYWEVASDGGVFSFGSAQFDGSMGGSPLNAPIVGMVAAPQGNGYWEVASDGGVFSFGSAQFDGSMGGSPLEAPIVGMVAAPQGNGYWEVASDGGVFSFGSARFDGSMGGAALEAPIVGMVAAPQGNGYWEVASDGGVFSFGSAGSTGRWGALRSRRPSWAWWPPQGERLLGGGVRRWGVQLRFRGVRRIDGGHCAQRTHRGHGGRPAGGRLLGGGFRRWGVQLRFRASSTDRWGALRSTHPSWA